MWTHFNVNTPYTFAQEVHSVAGQVALNKKQGVSGQSGSSATSLNIDKVDKDFHTRSLIKEAIQDNDFLKNLTNSQVNLNHKKNKTSVFCSASGYH